MTQAKQKESVAILEFVKTARTLSRQIKLLKTCNASPEEKKKILIVLEALKRSIDVYEI